MAERRGLLTRWRCARMRALLVDCADGTLSGEEQARVERHAAECGSCREDLESLRQVARARSWPAVPQPDDDFFRVQRQSILRRIRQAPPPRAAQVLRPRFGWLAGLATAAVVALVLLRQPPSPPPVPSPSGATMRALSDEDLAALSSSGDGDLVEAVSIGDELLAFGTVPLSDGEEWAPGPDVHELSDQELERLEDLLG